MQRPEKAQSLASNIRVVTVGDAVRVRYLTDDRRTLQVTISRGTSDPSNGIINYETPIAKALLGAEQGDQVEVLVGSYVRAAIVESIAGRGPDLVA